jgi:hypothetical protein
MSILHKIQTRARRLAVNLRTWQLMRNVASHVPRNSTLSQVEGTQHAPVVFFNASTRLNGISQNAAFSLLTALGLQLAGIPVVNFACKAGMSRCVLGAAYHDPSQPPPCKACIAQSRWLYANAPTISFEYKPDLKLSADLQNLSVDEIADFRLLIADWKTNDPQSTIRNQPSEIPLGQLTLPSIRWILRRHHLNDDESTRALFRELVLSAANVARHFDPFLETVAPQAVVVFNGQFFPEVTARWLARRRGIRVISHEVGLRPFTAFFTDGDATAYPLDIPADFELDDAQNARLDAYLSQRFQGQFSMAGVRFWSGMSGLDEAFLARAAGFKQIVPVFTNVIFDTSQPHANVVFPHMFAWLDLVLELARQHPETLFVLRAHPDESRPGKASRESVAQWVESSGAAAQDNIVFVASQQTLSSYELIQRSKFVMIYNSTIGLEAAILGAAVLCAGRARFTQLPTVFFPQSVEEYRAQAEDFLAGERISVPPEFGRNARRFLYYQLYRSSLPFGQFIEEDGIWPGFVRFKSFDWHQLTPECSPAMRTILRGLDDGGDFLLQEDVE